MVAIVIDFSAYRASRKPQPEAQPEAQPEPQAEAQPEPQAEAQPEAPRYVAAYCDPANLRVGSKYDRTLRTPGIAKRIRADLKAAKAAGGLHRDVKVSVTCESFSGGSAIRVSVTAVPTGFAILNADRVRQEKARPHDHGLDFAPRHTSEASALIASLTGIAKAYHRDNSDAMSDYSEVNFHLTVEFDWALEAAHSEALVQSLTAEEAP